MRARRCEDLVAVGGVEGRTSRRHIVSEFSPRSGQQLRWERDRSQEASMSEVGKGYVPKLQETEVGKGYVPKLQLQLVGQLQY